MKSNNVFTYMQECVKAKRDMGKESTAEIYQAACNRLCAFWKKSTMCWKDVTEELIDGFMVHLERKKLKKNTINAYISSLRAMYNSAVKKGLVKIPANPFLHLQLKREDTEKRALPRSVIEKLAGLDLRKYPKLRLALDCYIFSYLACGMPFVDLAHLTSENIHGDRIIYNRVKTKVKVSVGLTPGMKVILARYRRKGSIYLFPLLPDEENVSHKVYKNCLHCYNARLKKIGEMAGLETKLTSYVARHSWASEAHEQDLPMSVISQALGHSSEDTTRIYLERLSQRKLNKANMKVIRGVDGIVCKCA